MSESISASQKSFRSSTVLVLSFNFSDIESLTSEIASSLNFNCRFAPRFSFGIDDTTISFDIATLLRGLAKIQARTSTVFPNPIDSANIPPDTDAVSDDGPIVHSLASRIELVIQPVKGQNRRIFSTSWSLLIKRFCFQDGKNSGVLQM